MKEDKELSPSKLDDDELVIKVAKNIKKAAESITNWRDDAKEQYSFVAGDQWDEEDVLKLMELGRPAVVFNRISPIIDAVIGLQINSRTEVRYIPREVGDTAPNEILTNAAKWVADECDQEDEESDAFADMAICGMGWTETFMDYVSDPQGMLRIERRSPLAFWWDTGARQQNLQDARWVAYEKWLTKDEIKLFWNTEVISSGENEQRGVHVTSHERSYTGMDESFWYSKGRDRHRVLQYQWWEIEDYYRIADPAVNKVVEMDAQKFGKIKKILEAANIPYVKAKQRKYYQCFITGEQLLEKGASPDDENFTFRAMTGKRDEVKGKWYGIVKSMIDPQTWANKYFSQIQHILATGPKGGLLYEEGAFSDPRDAEDKWSSTDALIELKAGGLNLIKEKPQAVYPVGLDRLMEFAIGSLNDVTGMNQEIMGMRSANQAGVLEAQRTQKGMVILSRFFAAQRRYKKEQGRLMLNMMLEYMSDGRLIRISGNEGMRYVQLLRQDGFSEYDVVVDEQPSSPNRKEQTWQMLLQLIPFLLKAGYPVPPSVFDYSPLPNSLAQEWRGILQQKQQGEPADQASIEKDKAAAALDKVKAGRETVGTLQDYFGARK